MTEHIDLRQYDRKGWFTKYGGNPLNYRTECGSGYLGPIHQAHHILPGVSIKQSAQASKADNRYIKEVQYITDWNINHPPNMVGLPLLWTYALYYEEKGADTDEVSKYFNRAFWKRRRKKDIKKFGNANPERHPIHNPTSFGHVDYNAEVESEIQAQVWDPLQDKRKKHETQAENVKSQLEKLEKKWGRFLKRRGALARRKLWDRMINGDMVALQPFTMWDLTEHPLV